MSETAGDVLVVEDDPQLRSVLEKALPRLGYQVRCVAGPGEALGAVSELRPDVVLTDLELGSGNGLDVCAHIHEVAPGVPVLVMTAFGSLEAAIGAIRAGAYDFLTKPLDLEVLRIALDRALTHRRQLLELRALRRKIRTSAGFGEMIGESAAMQAVFRVLDRVARVESSVLIRGESGSGKELVARELHARSPRRDGPFVAISCAAVPETLLESELFGHTKGAFTDARGPRTGLISQAHGGTLFLDEIGDMPALLQPKLLRVLQERAFRPVGSDRELAANVRVVAATHQDLEALVASGRFRQDLLYRLDVITLEVPPLRERGSDVLLLAQRFLDRQAERLELPGLHLAPEAAQRLVAHDWPGNVRELQNCIERAAVLADGPTIGVHDLSPRVRGLAVLPAVPSANPDGDLRTLEEVEREHVLRVLAATGDSRTEAAKILEIDRKTLYRKLVRWGLASPGGAL